MTLKNDSLPQYLAVPADCLKLHSPLAPLVKILWRALVPWVSLFLAVLKCARNAMHSPHKIARDCQANEDDTAAKQSSHYNWFVGETFKILKLSFAKKHISSMFWVHRNLVYRRYTRCIGEFATANIQYMRFSSSIFSDCDPPPPQSLVTLNYR